MNRKPFLLASCAAAMLVSFEAHATGSISCEADDANLQFSAGSPVGRGMGGPIIDLQSSLEIKLQGTPADLAKHDLSKSLVHSWLEGTDVRLHFYQERAGDKPHGYVELVVKTVVKGDEGETEGDYTLTVFDTQPPAGQTDALTLTASGKAKCFVE